MAIGATMYLPEGTTNLVPWSVRCICTVMACDVAGVLVVVVVVPEPSNIHCVCTGHAKHCGSKYLHEQALK